MIWPVLGSMVAMAALWQSQPALRPAARFSFIIAIAFCVSAQSIVVVTL
jgi:hypothetical protein